MRFSFALAACVILPALQLFSPCVSAGPEGTPSEPALRAATSGGAISALPRSSAFSAAASSPYDTVLIPKVKTSIYLGSVSLTLTPFVRDEATGIYAADYKATVVPFFMFNERGNLRVLFTAEQITRLERGERVDFAGDGKNHRNAARPITGHAQADAPGLLTGKIKVRVFVTKKQALVFDTTYTFAERAPVLQPDDGG